LKKSVKILCVAAIVLLSITAVAAVLTTGLLSRGDTSVINKVQSGLVASDPLNKYQTQEQLQSNQTYWVYGGSAAAQNSSFQFFETVNQLHIGVSSLGQGQWAGFYAVTPATNASFVHALLTAGSNSTPGYYTTGLYVQASNQLSNYIACVAITTPKGTSWGVVHGSAVGQTVSINPLWVASANGFLSRDCAIATDGTTYLDVYLDHVQVYQSSVVYPVIPGPFNFAVESETNAGNRTIYGSYQNFYVALGQDVRVSNAPSKAVSVDIVDASGKIYATGTLKSGATSLNVGQYTFPLTAYVRAYSSATSHTNSTLVASTQGPVSIFGGDVYTFGNPTSSTSTLSLAAQDVSGNDIQGMFVTLSTNRQSVSTDYVPTAFTLNNYQTYSVQVYDYGKYTFDHWTDGSTSRVRTLSITRDTQIMAVYRNINSPLPPGQSVINVTATDLSGKRLSGFYVTLWQNGVMIGTAYSPVNFKVSNGAEYQVAIGDFGNYVFDHWSDGTKGQFDVVSPAGVTNLVAVFRSSG
jgi:hypothetical protein